MGILGAVIVRDSKITTTFGLDINSVLFFINNIKGSEITYMYNDSVWNINFSVGCIRIIIADIDSNNINYCWNFNEDDINNKDPKLLSLIKIKTKVNIEIPKPPFKKLKLDISPNSIAYDDEIEDKVLSPLNKIISSVISFITPFIPESINV